MTVQTIASDKSLFGSAKRGSDVDDEICRCALTAWPEARAIKAETARALGQWLFNDVICRLGCVRKIISDNVLQYKAALDWIEKKYGITGIQISSYNSQANGKIERGHWDLRQI